MNEGITDMTPLEEWLSQYSSERTQRKYWIAFDQFTELAKTNDIELVKKYRDADDEHEWAKTMGRTIIKFQNHLIEQG